MLLDEPGASSDPKNEHEMLHRIKQLGRDLSNPKVMIIVSHQYGTLTDADKIIVINNHTIEKIDTHHNLLSQKGTYFSAWQRQIESLVPGASVDIDPDGQPIFTSKRRSSDE
jgi:ABC-type multidrug transport system fused ATPase/permease subunit